MVGCSILKCKSRSDKRIEGITFHSFPSDPEVRRKWIKVTGRQNWQPNKSTKICSVHFDLDSFNLSHKITHLKPDAIPEKNAKNRCQIGDLLSKPLISQHIPKKKCEVDLKMPPKTLCSLENSTGHAKHSEKKFGKVQPNVMNNAQLSKLNLPTPESSPIIVVLKRELEKQRAISALRLKKLLAVRQSQRRLLQRVTSLENTVNKLKCRMLINSEDSEVFAIDDEFYFIEK